MVKKTILILLCLYSLLFLLGGIAAPVLAALKFYDLSGTLTYLFSGSCHQMPDRSFWIMGYPMALCSRCTGIYTGTVLAALQKVLYKKDLNNKVLLSLICFVFADIALNFFFAFNTGLIVRFIAGVLIGIILVEIVSKILDIVGIKIRKV